MNREVTAVIKGGNAGVVTLFYFVQFNFNCPPQLIIFLFFVFLQGDLSQQEKRAVFMTVHDLGCNRELNFCIK